MNNLSDVMKERLEKWRQNPHPDFQRAKQKMNMFQQQEYDMFKFEEENNARHNKRSHGISSKTK
jgi:hypothetical protein